LDKRPHPSTSLAQALEDYRQELRSRGGASDVSAEAVELLRDYLIDYAEIAAVDALTPADLEQFASRWYLDRDEAEPEGALALVRAVREWVRWLERRSPSALASSFDALAERLSEDLPRVLQARAILDAYTHREDLETDVTLGEDAESAPVPFLSSGVSRVIRPEEVDYARAEEDQFRLVALEGDYASLQSPSGEQLGEPPLSPVLLPPEVAPLLRIGDLLHVEVAPAGAVWEILAVTRILPGGYADDGG
jgi:hypothetical protein